MQRRRKRSWKSGEREKQTHLASIPTIITITTCACDEIERKHLAFVSKRRKTGWVTIGAYHIMWKENTVKPHYRGYQGTDVFSIFGGFLLLPIYEIKEISFMGNKNCFHYRWNYVTSGSGIARCDCSLIDWETLHIK